MLFVASKVQSGELEGCIGIQLCDESIWDANGMYAWYEDVTEAVREVDPSIPLYVSDAWDLNDALASVCSHLPPPFSLLSCITNHITS